MSIRSTSLEPKSQLTINLALKRKQKGENSRSKESVDSKKRKFPIKKKWEKAKKERKFPINDRKKTEEICRKGLWTRQHLNNTELSPSKQEKKGNHDLKWSSPFDCQPKSCVPVTCSPHTKQKQKWKRPRNTQSQISHKKKQTIPKKKSY